jgi:hypothetical protein
MQVRTYLALVGAARVARLAARVAQLVPKVLA